MEWVSGDGGGDIVVNIRGMWGRLVRLKGERECWSVVKGKLWIDDMMFITRER